LKTLAGCRPRQRSELGKLLGSFSDRRTLLKREEKMHTYMARTALECTSETGSDQAHFIRHAASACCVFF
jgi:hypothetical protein